MLKTFKSRSSIFYKMFNIFRKFCVDGSFLFRSKLDIYNFTIFVNYSMNIVTSSSPVKRIEEFLHKFFTIISNNIIIFIKHSKLIRMENITNKFFVSYFTFNNNTFLMMIVVISTIYFATIM